MYLHIHTRNADNSKAKTENTGKILFPLKDATTTSGMFVYVAGGVCVMEHGPTLLSVL